MSKILENGNKWYRVDVVLGMDRDVDEIRVKYECPDFPSYLSVPYSLVIEGTDQMSVHKEVRNNFDQLLLDDPQHFQKRIRVKVNSVELEIDDVYLATNSDIKEFMKYPFLTTREKYWESEGAS